MSVYCTHDILYYNMYIVNGTNTTIIGVYGHPVVQLNSEIRGAKKKNIKSWTTKRRPRIKHGEMENVRILLLR